MPKKNKKGRSAGTSKVETTTTATISASVDNTLKIEEEDTNNNNNNNTVDINEENQQTSDKPGMVIATTKQSIGNVTGTTTPHDEITEEFDFNDGLLSELSDKESLLEEHRAGGEQVVAEDQQLNGLGDSSKCIDDDNGDCEIEPAASAANKVTADNGSDCDKNATTTTVAAATMETMATTQQALINDNNDNKLNRPSNLLLGEHESTMSDAANLYSASSPPAEGEDSCCPITPRRIMDVEDTDSEGETRHQQQQLAKSQSKSNIKSANNNNNAGDVDNADGDDDDYDEYGDDYNPDDELLVQFLGEANRIAEARLAARRQARAEAREIRMRELERQQREQENNADRAYADGMHSSSSLDPLVQSRLLRGTGAVTGSPSTMLSIPRGNSLMSSRRSSEDSLEEEGRSLRDIRHELKDVEERFRKAMIANAQLDNERASQTYQIQLLKDKLEEMEESYAQLQREFKEKSRDYNALKRNLDKLTEELKLVQGQLNERDTLIGEQGLVIVAVENEDGTDAKRALVSVENAQLLGSVQGSLDVRLKKFSEEKKVLSKEVQNLQQQLEQYKQQGGGGGKLGRGNSMNGPSEADEDYEAQREANKIISDYKYKLQKAEQEIASLQASLARSETQVIRYKSTAEAAEKAEAELKIERRKLQRENREATERLEELETSNNHLLKRLDKLKNAKSALLKDL